MLNKFSINFRMLLLIILPAMILTAIGYTTLTVISQNKTALQESEALSDSISAINSVNKSINKDYTQLLSNINAGFVYWSAGEKKTNKAITNLQHAFDEFKGALTVEEKQQPHIQKIIKAQGKLVTSYKSFSKIFKQDEDKKALNAYVLKKMFPLANTITARLSKFGQKKHKLHDTLIASTISTSENRIKQLFIAVVGGMLASLILGFLIMRSITRPTKNLTEVVHRLAEGEFEARVEIKGKDEFSKLGTAFNSLLDDREATLQSVDMEHKELNQSVFSLLQAVAELSERNLTIRAEVTEDATGPVADAINLLAEETASTLSQVKNIAIEVNSASQRVNSHLMSVNKLAMQEQEQAIETAEQMDHMLQRLDAIANTAAETNTMADNTTLSTQKAHDSVTDTLDGMSEIRETVQETGKRIKQLGERSQEISHVIEIINTIAERTTVLALNASMQATAAGDAGRGFSVIAEEIQRLAESSRESTGQISTLVRNIQQETNTTIATMDQTIEQVVNGSTKAEDAAKQMKEVLKTTSQLVEAVNDIATTSREQVGITEVLKHKAESILKSTQSTGQELLSLTGLSRNMSEYAQRLVQSVNVFKLDNKVEEDSTQAEA